jgi:hypothetical protein
VPLSKTLSLSLLDAVVPPAALPSCLLPGRWRLGTHNCGLLTSDKASRLAATICALALDVVALQEIGRPSAETTAAFAVSGPSCIWSPRADVDRPSGGTGFVYNQSRQFLQPVTRCTCAGVEQLTVEWRSAVGNASLRLMSVYAAPHSEVRPLQPATFSGAFVAALRSWRPDIALGDFNARHTAWDPFVTGAGSYTAQRGAHLLHDARALGLGICAPAAATRGFGLSTGVWRR